MNTLLYNQNIYNVNIIKSQTKRVAKRGSRYHADRNRLASQVSHEPRNPMTEASPGSRQSVESLASETKPGQYFVSNYPPFSEWSEQCIPEFLQKLNHHSIADRPLGLYFHIPFCRKRCNFCYFKVYADKDQGDIDAYLGSMINELEIYANTAYVNYRPVDFIYFGGGTPSYLSVEQLAALREKADLILPWHEAKEISFEAEPGTLNRDKLECIKQLGVTRLSLGVESFSDDVLQANNRSHQLKHILNSYEIARMISFDQINIDLIAGLQEENEASWDHSIQKALELSPDSITIYQLEVPYNTLLYKQIRDSERQPVLHSWDTKFSWARYAFQVLEQAGYVRTSAYTAVKDPSTNQFRYRDALWHGSDLLAVGVASFGHLGGSLYQNEKDFGRYIDTLKTDDLPVHRCYELSQEEALIRELILQLKLGRVSIDAFARKFDIQIDILYQTQLEALRKQNIIRTEDNVIVVEKEALLKIDAWLDTFYLPQHLSSLID